MCSRKNIILLLALVFAEINGGLSQCDFFTNLNELSVIVFMNGDSETDKNVLNSYCGSTFTSDVVSIEFRIGAKVEVNDLGKLSCIGEDGPTDCVDAIKLACVSIIIPELLSQFLCCTTARGASIDSCVGQYSISVPVNNCIDSDAPVGLILANIQTASTYSVRDMPPYFIYNEVFDECTSNLSKSDFTGTICSVLSNRARQSQPACVNSK